MARLTISLVTFNGASTIEPCVQSICLQSFTDWELVVFDNASTDDTVTRIKNLVPTATIIQSESNAGFAFGHNEVIRHSSAPYILILNQDVTLDSDYCKECIAAFETGSTIGSVTGMLLRTESLEDLPKDPVLDGCGLWIDQKYFVRLRGEEDRPSSYQDSCEVFGVPATAAFYRLESLKDSAEGERPPSYFDESFFMYKEDVDLSYRLAWRGWKSWYCAHARAHHIRTKRRGLRPSRFVNTLSYRNNLALELKNLSGGILVRFGGWIFLMECAKLVYLLFREPHVLASLGRFFCVIPELLRKRRNIFLKRRAPNTELLYWYSHRER